MPDVTGYALGKKLGVVHDPRTFHLRSLLDTSALPKVPPNWRYAHNLHSVPMFANDVYGCCTFASQGHRIVAQEYATQQVEVKLTDAAIINGYADVTGFDPVTGANDNGAYMLDVANYMRRTGIGREKDGTRHTIDAFVKVDHTNHAEVKTACNLFGGVWVGVALPVSAQSQMNPGVWQAPADGGAYLDYSAGSWGGHAIEVTAYNRDRLMAYTWGEEQYMTWAFWDAYVDECYAFVSEDWFRKGGTTVRGFNATQLKSWLSELR